MAKEKGKIKNVILIFLLGLVVGVVIMFALE